jgi:hypothetical protein
LILSVYDTFSKFASGVGRKNRRNAPAAVSQRGGANIRRQRLSWRRRRRKRRRTKSDRQHSTG